MSSPTSTPAANAARRRFLVGIGVGAAALGGTLAGIDGAAARAPEEPASAGQRFGLLIDTERCATGCEACVTACDEEHGIGSNGRPATDPRWIRKVGLRNRATGREVSLPMMCQHCAEPPCVDVCPTGASFKRADGVVLVNRHTCIGCRYCMMACPFNARTFIHEDVTGQKPHAPRGKGTVESCTLCVHRIDAGDERGPACAEACTAAGHRAIVFGDLADPESGISRALREEASTALRADLNLGQAVRYRNL